MEIKLKLDRTDWEKSQPYICSDFAPKTPSFIDSFFGSMIILFFISIISMFVYRQFNDFFHWQSALLVSFLLLAIYLTDKLGDLLSQKHLSYPDSDSVYFKTSVFKFDENGISAETDGAMSFFPWKNALRVSKHDGFIYIFIEKGLAYTFPEYKLDEPEVLYEYICEKFDSQNKLLNQDATDKAPVS